MATKKGTSAPDDDEGGSPTSKPRSAQPGEASESKAFRKALKSAEEILQDPRKTATMAARARKKLGDSRDRLDDVFEELEALIRMIQAYAKKEYRDVPWTTIVAAAAAVIYFVMPIDLIPDPLVGLGYVDDVTVVLFVMGAIQRDIDAFERWEEKHGRRT